MSYVDDQLISGERVIHRTSLHPIIFASGALICLLGIPFLVNAGLRPVGAVILVIGLVKLGLAAIRHSSSEFAVTTSRVIIKVGWLNHRTIELQLGKVEGLAINQPLLGRMLGFGTLTVGGTGGTQERFAFIQAPLEFRKSVQQQATGPSLPAKAAGALAPASTPDAEQRQERDCPHCAERILAKATRCRFCGQSVVPLTLPGA